ncbi:MAG: histidine phosphatase family protein [Candidatus Promineifilaceae bacterium]
MKTLLILRHAKSSWDNAYLADHDRPLSGRGKADAPRMGRLVAQEGLTPQMIFSSSAERALATAEAVALACGYEETVAVRRSLYHADPADYLEVLQSAPETAQCVMVVGHNPGLEELVEALTGTAAQMPTGALAQVELPVMAWREVNEETVGRLVQLWRPRDVA